jgi:AcrR family transcriptional regulator
MQDAGERKRAPTKKRLIEAAVALFAEHGFEKTTIHEIAERAGANIAAVNYHFGNKERFHAEVIRHQLDRASGSPPELAGEDGDPAVQLGAFIGWFLRRVCGPASEAPLQHILMNAQKENDGHGLDAIVDEVMRPQFERLSSLVAALLPPDTPADTLRRHCFSVISQITCHRHAWPVLTRLFPDLVLDEDELDAITDHVTRSSLAALAAESEGSPT